MASDVLSIPPIKPNFLYLPSIQLPGPGLQMLNQNSNNKMYDYWSADELHKTRLTALNLQLLIITVLLHFFLSITKNFYLYLSSLEVNKLNPCIKLYTGLFEMIVGVLTTCHTQYNWDGSICIFLFNRTYIAPVRYVLLNKNTYTPISSVLCMTSC
jgi:hypothetical protein